MKNYRYRVKDQDFIVSEEENENVKAAILAGKTKIFFRSGKIAHLEGYDFPYGAIPTDNPIDINPKDEVLALKGESKILEGIGDRRDLKYLNETHEDFYSRMKWAHGNGDCCKRAGLRNGSLKSELFKSKI